MKYILDFDQTLFDTNLLKSHFERDGIDYSNLSPLLLQNYPTANYLFEDVEPFLSCRPKEDIIILTAFGREKYGEGVVAYQKYKVEQEPINSLVGEVVYVEGDKGEAAAEIASQFPPHEPVIFVDDLLVQCKSVATALPNSTCCLIVRDPSNFDSTSIPDHIYLIFSLAELDGIIGNI